jgi:Tfp pilus assembly major pilin PilA
MFCPKCRNSNGDSSKFCSGCGTALSQADNIKPSLHAEIIPLLNSVQAESDEPHNSDEFYKAIVGPKNQDYYLSQFARFDSNGKANASWHWPAFFVTFYWFLYRKMWLNALIYFLLPNFVTILLGIAGAATGKSSDTVVGIGSLLYLIVAFVLPPMYANALYYKHCKKKIAEARLSSQDTQRRLGELSEKGGTSKVVIILVLISASITFIGILAAVAIPAYQDYTKKARMVNSTGVRSDSLSESQQLDFDRTERTGTKITSPDNKVDSSQTNANGDSKVHPINKNWRELVSNPAYAALSENDKEAVRNAYIEQHVAPYIPPDELPAVHDYFKSQVDLYLAETLLHDYEEQQK